ncbi:DUF3164 family protein [Maridesulfovibrio sp.]|uniref:DUF3164 family protein n=1 Tax=Maridesulfovibrio sp. TaxID=2795000 RepID=UPI002AA74390|nr:DUF3164 family protein [Maridesulfovibrio sp.]
MDNEAIIDGKYMKNSKGHLVPVEQVSDYDKERDELVRRLILKAGVHQESLSDFKIESMGDVYAFMELAFEKYGAKKRELKNFRLTTFDGTGRVEVAVNDFLDFDEQLQAAKSLVDDCLIGWTEDARPEIQAVVNQAFETDKEGSVSPSKILPLMRLDIDDKDWNKAMKAVKDSMCVQYSKKYIRFKRRTGPEGKWENIVLDIAAL